MDRKIVVEIHRLLLVCVGCLSLNAHKSVRGSILESLAEVVLRIGGIEAAARPELFITGHSLGGAMATLMLADILSDPESLPFKPSRTLVMHYGSPMVGDAAFRQADAP